MLAERLAGLLPPLTPEEALTVTRIHSAAGCTLPDGALFDRPPFRAPHHQASIVSLVGGGSWSLRPGEVSLATNGVLFLDELGEFPVAALEALRQPLEEGVIRVSRAGGTVTFPAAFLLVAAMNPCPCGEGVYEGACTCSQRRPRPVPPPDLGAAAGPFRSRRAPQPARPRRAPLRRARASLRRPSRSGWRPAGHGPRRGLTRRVRPRTSRPMPRRCSARSSGRAPSAPAGCTRSRGWPARSPTSPGRTRCRSPTWRRHCRCVPAGRSVVP